MVNLRKLAELTQNYLRGLVDLECPILNNIGRIVTTKSYWPNILLSQISHLQGENISAGQLLQLGPCLLAKIGKSLKNKFWGQVLQSTIKMSEGAAYCKPEMIIFGSFWFNPLIRRNNKVIKYTDFPEIKTTIVSLANFYHQGTNTFMEYEAFKDHYNIEISEIKYIDIRFTINLALQKLNLTSPRSSKRCSRSNLPINLETRKFRVFQTIFLERDTRKILKLRDKDRGTDGLIRNFKGKR